MRFIRTRCESRGCHPLTLRGSSDRRWFYGAAAAPANTSVNKAGTPVEEGKKKGERVNKSVFCRACLKCDRVSGPGRRRETSWLPRGARQPEWKVETQSAS